MEFSEGAVILRKKIVENFSFISAKVVCRGDDDIVRKKQNQVFE